jgi:hypothetical protein
MKSQKVPNPPETSAIELEILYSKQRNLLERLQIHQRNLEKLSLQEAKFGMAVPLPLMNEIELQQTRISEIAKELIEVDDRINEITRKVMEPGSSHGQPLTTINIDDVDYAIECPFPALGSTSKMLAEGHIQSEYHYVGGFEIHALLRSDSGMEITFYRHGRRVAPTIDKEAHKIILSLGLSIAVSAVVTGTLRMETAEDVTPERIAEGRWTIISPGNPQQPIMKVDWPQGYKDYIMTTKMPFEGGYEVWMVQTLHNHPAGLPLILWFYIKDWNVAPVIDEGHLLLRFPEQIPG